MGGEQAAEGSGRRGNNVQSSGASCMLIRPHVGTTYILHPLRYMGSAFTLIFDATMLHPHSQDWAELAQTQMRG